MSTEVAVTPNIELDPVALALVRADVPSARIESLAKDFGELAQRTEPIETEDEYKQIHTAQLACRDVRIAVVAALKAEREDAVKYQKHVVAEEKRILAIIEQTEEPLKKLKDEWNKREELKQLAEANAWAEKMKMRKEAAFDVGFTFNGMAYTCSKDDGTGEYWTLREDQVAGLALSDDALYTLLADIAGQLKVTREINAEAAAKAKEEQDAKEAAIAAQMAELKAKQMELDRLLSEAQAQKDAQERAAREQQMREEAAAAAVEAERVRLANEAEAKKKQEALAAQQEQERIAAMGDVGKAEMLMLALVNIPIDAYTSASGRAMALRIKKFKDGAIDIVDTFIRDNSND